MRLVIVRVELGQRRGGPGVISRWSRAAWNGTPISNNSAPFEADPRIARRERDIMLDKGERTSLSDTMRTRDAVEHGDSTLISPLKGTLIAREVFVCSQRYIIMRQKKR